MEHQVADSSYKTWRLQTIPEEPDRFIGISSSIAYAVFLLFMAVIEFHFFLIPWIQQIQTRLYI